MAQKHRPLSDDALALIARRFAVLGEPMRLRILQSLLSGAKPVHKVVAETGGTQANISRHLQTLAAAGMVNRRKAGLEVFYAVADPSIFELCALVCGSLEKQHTARASIFS